MPRSRVEGESEHPYSGPATILFVTPRARLADRAEELLSNVASTRILPVEPDGVCLLDFDQSVTAVARDAQNMPRQQGQALPGYAAVRTFLGSWIGKDGLPVLLGHPGPCTALQSAHIGRFGSQLLHFSRGWHTPAFRPIRHGAQEHIPNIKPSPNEVQTKLASEPKSSAATFPFIAKLSAANGA